jgi:hypothetical protein
MAENLAHARGARPSTHWRGDRAGGASHACSTLGYGYGQRVLSLCPHRLWPELAFVLASHCTSFAGARRALPRRLVGAYLPLIGCCKRQSPRCRVCLQWYSNFLDRPPRVLGSARGPDVAVEICTPNLQRGILRFNPQIPATPGHHWRRPAARLGTAASVRIAQQEGHPAQIVAGRLSFAMLLSYAFVKYLYSPGL